MGYTQIPGTDHKVSRIALGTWAIGGWMWGGTEEAESVRTIHQALEAVDDILKKTIKDPVGPEFMAPPPRRPD
jgi:diketogulonate reductase-like aldo/keto reductase